MICIVDCAQPIAQSLLSIAIGARIAAHQQQKKKRREESLLYLPNAIKVVWTETARTEWKSWWMNQPTKTTKAVWTHIIETLSVVHDHNDANERTNIASDRQKQNVCKEYNLLVLFFCLLPEHLSPWWYKPYSREPQWSQNVGLEYEYVLNSCLVRVSYIEHWQINQFVTYPIVERVKRIKHFWYLYEIFRAHSITSWAHRGESIPRIV